jgi:hypothetical protein
MSLYSRLPPCWAQREKQQTRFIVGDGFLTEDASATKSVRDAMRINLQTSKQYFF